MNFFSAHLPHWIGLTLMEWMELWQGLGSIVGIGAIAYLLLCFVVWKWQNRLIFFPSSQITNTPEQWGMDYEVISIPIPERSQEFLYSWWIPASGPPRGVVLQLHGNGFNVGANLDQSHVFHQLGYSVLLFDYRGYGQSRGPFPREKQVYEDAEVALDYLLKERGCRACDVVVYGHSLGGAIAIELATHHPDLAALIIQCSFTSLTDMIDHDGIYKIFPVQLLLNHHFDSLSKLPHLNLPILFIHSAQDRRIPARMSQTLFEAAKHPHKALYIVPDAGHNNAASAGGEPYRQQVDQFLSQLSS
ncbi:alpha/beta hydrolase [Spirulina subsalsa FACHB-351]|uniref:Alpha/beta hydrolase n=1 Tax=Spirulina subsalsa FACHB-351 TaxID=234711 RepID=A0ABT3L7D7_9CYAN|nr:alpha/beta hydrolase [Spirulina subsalsa]MCW6037400.1 alpha/beta hydrolase [Spirulina subsalsa FACHB-351]